MGIAAPIAAVALGAAFIEKHFTCDRGDGAVDAAFSLEPSEFKEMADACRNAWQALGRARIGPSEIEINQRRFRRSLYAVRDIAAGEKITKENVRSVRPANGLHPRYLNELIGRHAVCAISRGMPIEWTLVEKK